MCCVGNDNDSRAITIYADGAFAGMKKGSTLPAFLLPARVLASAPEAASTGTGRFDDLLLADFTGRELATIIRLDFSPGHGILMRFAHPPHPSKMIALLLASTTSAN